jgi:hypothetical protein
VARGKWAVVSGCFLGRAGRYRALHAWAWSVIGLTMLGFTISDLWTGWTQGGLILFHAGNVCFAAVMLLRALLWPEPPEGHGIWWPFDDASQVPGGTLTVRVCLVLLLFAGIGIVGAVACQVSVGI